MRHTNEGHVNDKVYFRQMWGNKYFTKNRSLTRVYLSALWQWLWIEKYRIIWYRVDKWCKINVPDAEFVSINRPEQLNIYTYAGLEKTSLMTSHLFLKNLHLSHDELYLLICLRREKNNWSGYLRANEKWAEALGEKFLGLSCGLVPTRGKKRKEDTVLL